MLDLFIKATRENPLVKKVWIVVGLAAAGAIAVSLFRGNWGLALGTTIVALLLTVLGYALLRREPEEAERRASALQTMTSWVLTVLVLLSASLGLSSVFFGWPIQVGAGDEAPTQQKLLKHEFLGQLRRYADGGSFIRVSDIALAPPLNGSEKEILKQINWLSSALFGRYLRRLEKVIENQAFLDESIGFASKMQGLGLTTNLERYLEEKARGQISLSPLVLEAFVNTVEAKIPDIEERFQSADRDGGPTNAHKLYHLFNKWNVHLNRKRQSAAIVFVDKIRGN